eukprot:2191282-Prymnesium_polylepis.3
MALVLTQCTCAKVPSKRLTRMRLGEGRSRLGLRVPRHAASFCWRSCVRVRHNTPEGEASVAARRTLLQPLPVPSFRKRATLWRAEIQGGPRATGTGIAYPLSLPPPRSEGGDRPSEPPRSP